MAHPGGRPCLLTPELIEDVRRILPTLLYLETLSDYLGLDRSTWAKWLRRGRKESQRLARNPQAAPNPKEALHLEFFLSTKRALAEGALCDLQTIRKAASGQRIEVGSRETTHPDGSVTRETVYEHIPPCWTAAAWRLERRFPKRWGRRSQHQADANVTGTGTLFTFAEIGVSQRRDALPSPELDEPETPRLGHKEAEP